MIRTVSIRNGKQGTWDTLALMYSMALQGSTNNCLWTFILSTPMVMWNQEMAAHWHFAEESEETLRSIDTQVRNLIQYGGLIGDCDDAAIVAAACALAARAPFKIVAVRSPEATSFGHVFVEIQGPSGSIYRLDPTGPLNADYKNWERLEYPK